jgi:hypothetical protein
MNRRPTRIVEQLDPTSEHVRFIDDRGEPVEATFSGSSGTVQLPEIDRADYCASSLPVTICMSSGAQPKRFFPRGREPFKKFFL